MARPTRRLFKKNGTTLFDTEGYSYDASGNITAIGADTYQYDMANRLVGSTVVSAGTGKYENYEYDELDNLTKVTSDFFSRTYDVDQTTNRISETTGFTGPSTDLATFGYDTAGNTTSLAGATFEYDDLNMQTHFTFGGDELISIYGPGDYRVWAEDVSTGIKYWTSRAPDGKILREYEVTGDLDVWVHKQDYVYGAEGILATRHHTSATPTRVFHTDHLGTARLFTSGQGAELSKHHYYPFGREACPGVNNKCDPALLDEPSVKFTGHQRERHKQAYYMLGRHYLPYTYRFGSVDPGRDGWNLYSYTGGDPIGKIDPTGRESVAILQFERDARATLYGEMSQAEFQERNAARANGALLGASLFSPFDETALAIRAFGYLTSRLAIRSGIRAALRSSVAAIRFEGRIGSQLGRSVVGFQRIFRRADGSIRGEVDIDTSKYFIELAHGGGKGKTSQIENLLGIAAEEGKGVILYGPNLKGSVEKAAREAGALVIRDFDELKKVVSRGS